MGSKYPTTCSFKKPQNAQCTQCIPLCWPEIFTRFIYSIMTFWSVSTFLMVTARFSNTYTHTHTHTCTHTQTHARTHTYTHLPSLCNAYRMTIEQRQRETHSAEQVFPVWQMVRSSHCKRRMCRNSLMVGLKHQYPSVALLLSSIPYSLFLLSLSVSLSFSPSLPPSPLKTCPHQSINPT